MMADMPEVQFCLAAAGDVRFDRPTGTEAKGGWFCLDDHLWIRRPPILEGTVKLPLADNLKTVVNTEVSFKLRTMTLRSSGLSPANWANVPEGQALIAGVASHIDRHLARARASARGPLPDAAPTLTDAALPQLEWPDPQRGRISRVVHTLKRWMIWPGVATYQARMRTQNRDRNLILKPFDIAEDRTEAGALLPDTPLPDHRLARFVQRLQGLIQPMDTQVALSLAPDLMSVDLDVAQTGRIDLLTGVSAFNRTQSGLEVLRLEGADRDVAINAYVLKRLVVLARSFEASWEGPMPRLSVRLTLAGLPETRIAQLLVEARGWGFGLAQLAVGLPTIPVHFPDGIALRLDPVVPQSVPPSDATEPPIRTKPAAAGPW